MADNKQRTTIWLTPTTMKELHDMVMKTIVEAEANR